MAFIIWSLVSLIFIFIGIGSYRAKEEAGFFSGVKPPKTKDVKAYNHAVGKLWIVFALLFELIGIPLIYIQQNSPVALFIGMIAVFLIIGIIIIYLFIERKYRE